MNCSIWLSYPIGLFNSAGPEDQQIIVLISRLENLFLKLENCEKVGQLDNWEVS